MHVWYASQAALAARAVDSVQLAWVHVAHVFVPYGSPQMLVTRPSGGVSVMPTSWRQARTAVIAAAAATSPSHPTGRPI
jgi:hypothetical protein